MRVGGYRYHIDFLFPRELKKDQPIRLESPQLHIIMQHDKAKDALFELKPAKIEVAPSRLLLLSNNARDELQPIDPAEVGIVRAALVDVNQLLSGVAG